MDRTRPRPPCAPLARGERPSHQLPATSLAYRRLPFRLPDRASFRVVSRRKLTGGSCQEKRPKKAANPRFPQGLTHPVASCRLLSEAPRVGFEPTTNRLTAGCSTIELSGNGRNGG